MPFFATSAAGHFVGRLQAALTKDWPDTHLAPTMDSPAWRGRTHP
ncbi:hypothetical protein [Methylobacterium aquaticum]|nr:hypothetical protein [Methylobacterium aquaticum]